jgi:hypothetical protein
MKATAGPEKSLLTAASRGAPHLHCPSPPATVAFRSHPHQRVAVRPHVLTRVGGAFFSIWDLLVADLWSIGFGIFRFGICSWPNLGSVRFRKIFVWNIWLFVFKSIDLYMDLVHVYTFFRNCILMYLSGTCRSYYSDELRLLPVPPLHRRENEGLQQPAFSPRASAPHLRRWSTLETKRGGVVSRSSFDASADWMPLQRCTARAISTPPSRHWR